jgi:quinol-cytochrome oxidoreductase complex cytochrome b subunit
MRYVLLFIIYLIVFSIALKRLDTKGDYSFLERLYWTTIMHLLLILLIVITYAFIKYW